MLKSVACTDFISVIAKVFNVILVHSHFPSLWKVGFISPIYKGDDPTDPGNYRGITVTSCFRKLFTLVMNERLIRFLDLNNTLNHAQIGFRQGYRTADHIFVLQTIVKCYFKKNVKIFACFVDFSKAYDTIWRNGLLYKLIE